jgi:hypothetical protein
LQTADGWWAVHVIAGPFATEQEALRWIGKDDPDMGCTTASADERPPWE